MVGDGGIDGGRIDPAQADVGAAQGRDGPGEAPAIAVEHGQGPEIDRMVRHVPADGVGDRVQISAPVMIDHALGVARGAGGIVEGDRLPFVLGQVPLEILVPFGHQAFVIGFAQGDVLMVGFGIDDVDDQDIAVDQGEGRFHRRREFRIGQQTLGLAVVEAKGDGLRVQAHVERIDDRPQHGHGEDGLIHLGRIRPHDGDRIQMADAPLGQGRGQFLRPRVGLAPGEALGAMDHRGMIGIHAGHPFQEGVGGQGGIIGANRV